MRGKFAQVGIVITQDSVVVAAEDEDVQVRDRPVCLQPDDKGSLTATERIFVLVRILVAIGERRSKQGTHYYVCKS